MLEQVCAFIHNYFDADRRGNYWHHEQGDFTIEDGSIALPFLVPGQYFRIIGSRLNDGVYQYPAVELTDETFTGEIWEMRIPRGFLDVVGEIEDWVDQYGENMKSPYQSESVIGVYEYTKMTSGKYNGEYIATWQHTFHNQLNEWRKVG